MKGWRNSQTKAKEVHDLQTDFTRNAKETCLNRKKRPQLKNIKIMNGRFSLLRKIYRKGSRETVYKTSGKVVKKIIHIHTKYLRDTQNKKICKLWCQKY